MQTIFCLCCSSAIRRCRKPTLQQCGQASLFLKSCHIQHSGDYRGCQMLHPSPRPTLQKYLIVIDSLLLMSRYCRFTVSDVQIRMDSLALHTSFTFLFPIIAGTHIRRVLSIHLVRQHPYLSANPASIKICPPDPERQMFIPNILSVKQSSFSHTHIRVRTSVIVLEY